MSHPGDSADPVEALRAHVKDIRIAMLCTNSDGRVVSRPMSVQELGQDGKFWFLASADSHKVDDIAANPSVGIMIVDPGAATYVSVTGDARVSNDRAQIAEFWNPLYKAWFEGPDDPAIRVIEVSPVSAEYWVTKGGKFVSFVSMLASAVTGKHLETGENKTLQL